MPAMIAVSPEVESFVWVLGCKYFCWCLHFEREGLSALASALMSGSCSNKMEVLWCDKMMLMYIIKKKKSK